MTMSAWSTFLHDVAGPLTGGLIGGGFALQGYRVNNAYQQQRLDQERASAANAALRELTQELFVSVGALHMALKTHIPAHNSWQPKLTTIGMAMLEYAAAKSRDGHYVGMARGAQEVLAGTQQEKDAALALRAPVERVLAATGQAALLPSGDVRDAALELGQAATASATAYGQDNLWRPRKARQARDEADAALYAALEKLIGVVNAQLHPVGEPPRSRRSWSGRRRTVPAAAPAAIESTIPAPRTGGHDASSAPKLPAP